MKKKRDDYCYYGIVKHLNTIPRNTDSDVSLSPT